MSMSTSMTTLSALTSGEGAAVRLLRLAGFT